MRKFLTVAVAVLGLVIALPALRAQTAPAGNGASGAATASPAIDGKWHFVLETPGGDREVDADFTVDKEGNVTGKWGSADVAGTYKEGKLDLKFPFTSDEVGTTADMAITGKLDETAALTGDWEFSEYNGTYKAMRPDAAQPAPAPAPSETPAPGSSDPKPQ